MIARQSLSSIQRVGCEPGDCVYFVEVVAQFLNGPFVRPRIFLFCLCSSFIYRNSTGDQTGYTWVFGCTVISTSYATIAAADKLVETNQARYEEWGRNNTVPVNLVFHKMYFV